MLTTVLAILATSVVALSAAARIPGAAADLVRACLPLIEAVRELHAALTTTRPEAARPAAPASPAAVALEEQDAWPQDVGRTITRPDGTTVEGA